MTSFADMQLDARLLRALTTLHYTQPTPIQAQAIGPALTGRDILGCAQTGTGKTAGFALPVLHRLASRPKKTKGPKALVLAPTRELAAQIAEQIAALGQNLDLTCTLLIGGVGLGPQAYHLRAGTDIIVATPGRLRDHIERGSARLGDVEILVLDEADRMLDMGFVNEVRAIAKLVSQQRQTLLFSATLPQSIMRLAHELLTNPQTVQVQSATSTPTLVQQIQYPVMSINKRRALLMLLDDPSMRQVIVFARTKHGVDKLGQFLGQNGHSNVVLHGNKSQGQRKAALARFKDGQARLLVATDIAARGIDVAGISHVVNFDAPQAPEDYVHRIGRTGRAEKKGVALSLVDAAERSMMRMIERLTRVRIEVQHLEGMPPPPPSSGGPPPRGGRGGQSHWRRRAA